MIPLAEPSGLSYSLPTCNCPSTPYEVKQYINTDNMAKLMRDLNALEGSFSYSQLLNLLKSTFSIRNDLHQGQLDSLFDQYLSTKSYSVKVLSAVVLSCAHRLKIHEADNKQFLIYLLEACNKNTTNATVSHHPNLLKPVLEKVLTDCKKMNLEMNTYIFLNEKLKKLNFPN